MLADAWRQFRKMPCGRRIAILAAFSAWALAAFDYFLVLVFANQIAVDLYQHDPAIYGGFSHWLSDIPIAPVSDQVDAFPVICIAITVTLSTRFIGALVFGAIADGAIADRFDKRWGLAAVIFYYSILAFLQAVPAVAASFWGFVALRALFGLAMGGEWGIGASLVMELLPENEMPSAEEALDNANRGLFSGIIQQGYPFGNLCAALAALAALAVGGAVLTWHQLFLVGGVFGLLLLPICLGIEEFKEPKGSKDNAQPRANLVQQIRGIRGMIQHAWNEPMQDSLGFWKNGFTRGLYAVGLVFALQWMVHSSQDLYPTFLLHQVGLTRTSDRLWIIFFYSISAFLGTFLFGYRSAAWGRSLGRPIEGRRRVIALAAVFGILLTPLWSGIFPLWANIAQADAFGSKPALFPLPPQPSIVLLIIGVFLMQFVMRGVTAVLPASVAYLSRHGERVRLSATHLGFTYGLGASLTFWIPLVVARLARFAGSAHPGSKAITPNFAAAQMILVLGAFIFLIFWITAGRSWLRKKSAPAGAKGKEPSQFAAFPAPRSASA